MSTHQPPGERHASWIELFFDLVLVAGVLQLSHLLHESPAPADLGLYVLLYLAFWISWVCFTVYGNVEGIRAGTPGLLLAMPGPAVMVSAVPRIRTDHTTAFVCAYVFLRWLSGRLWRPGRIVVDWPLAHIGGGTAPWIVPVWVDPPVRYWSARAVLVVGHRPRRRSADHAHRIRKPMAQSAQERVARTVKRYGSSEHVPVVEAAYADVPHLVERLGLFVIIVLGEGVIQIASAAGQAVWDAALIGAAAGAFALAAVVAGASWRRILLWALPCLLLTLLLALAAGRLGAVWLLWGLVAAVVWQIVCASDVPGRLSGLRRPAGTRLGAGAAS
ncbi:low temperature requirement protein A [Streptomyces sp. NBC_00161]|uniref:low temperature requirement protein A n=1 Tax=Streptomyces sp. NBC_00161 TaxID=2975671 RepID=UPI003251DAEE